MKHFTYSTKFYNSKTKKSNNTTNNRTTHSKTFCCTKLFTDGLPNFWTVTKPSYKQHKNNFAEHNCNYVKGPKTTKTKKNTQIFAQKQNVPQPFLNSVNFHDQPRSSQEQNGNYPFFQQRKNNANNYHTKKSTSSLRTKNFPSDHDETIIRITNDSPQTKDFVLTEMINQIFSNHTHEMNK